MKKQDLMEHYCENETSLVDIMFRGPVDGNRKLYMSVSFKDNFRNKPLNYSEYEYLCDDNDDFKLIKRIISDFINDDRYITKVSYKKGRKRFPNLYTLEILKENKSKMIISSSNFIEDYPYIIDMLLDKKMNDFYSYSRSFIDFGMVDNIVFKTNKALSSSIKYWEGNDEFIIESFKKKYPKRELEYIVPSINNNSDISNKILDNNISCVNKIIFRYIDKYKKKLLYIIINDEECIYQFEDGRIQVEGKYLIKNTIGCYNYANDIISNRTIKSYKPKQRRRVR